MGGAVGSAERTGWGLIGTETLGAGIDVGAEAFALGANEGGGGADEGIGGGSGTGAAAALDVVWVGAGGTIGPAPSAMK